MGEENLNWAGESGVSAQENSKSDVAPRSRLFSRHCHEAFKKCDVILDAQVCRYHSLYYQSDAFHSCQIWWGCTVPRYRDMRCLQPLCSMHSLLSGFHARLWERLVTGIIQDTRDRFHLLGPGLTSDDHHDQASAFCPLPSETIFYHHSTTGTNKITRWSVLLHLVLLGDTASTDLCPP